MKTVKLMVVGASREHEKKLIGVVFEAIKCKHPDGEPYMTILDGYLNGYFVNPLDLDADLTIRTGPMPEDVLFNLRKVSKASQRKLLVRALKLQARNRGWTDSYIRKFGEFSGVGDWARAWADWYFDKDGKFSATYIDGWHGTEHDPASGYEWQEFIEFEFDAL